MYSFSFWTNPSYPLKTRIDFFQFNHLETRLTQLNTFYFNQTQLNQSNSAYNFKIYKPTVSFFNCNVLETQLTQLKPTFIFQTQLTQLKPAHIFLKPS